MLACKNGRTDVVELLIKHNANVNARTKVRQHTRDNIQMKSELHATEVTVMCVCICACCACVYWQIC